MRPADAQAPVVPADAPGPAQAGASGLTYRLVDTWRDAPWRLTPGRYGQVGDVSSAPDGTIYVLDVGHGAVHVLSRRGVAQRVFRLPNLPPSVDGGTGSRARRLDVGADGVLNVLRTVPADPLEPVTLSWIDRLAPNGTRRGGFSHPRGYTDVAAHPNGRVLLSRTEPLVVPTPEPRQPALKLPGGVDVHEPDGPRVRSIVHPSVFYAVGVDVAADGTVYVVNRVPSPWDYDRPGPQPTPPPAWLEQPGPEPAPLPAWLDQPGQEPAQSSARLDQGPGAEPAQPSAWLDQAPEPEETDPIEGIVIFDPTYDYVETVAFTTPEDVAVGPAGVFVARNVEVFPLRGDAPIYSGPAGQVVVGFYDGVVLHLDAPADGRLLAGMAHCYFQGLVSFDSPWSDPVVPRFDGALDRPALEGPVFPRRLDAGDDVAVLQGRFAVAGGRPDRQFLVLPYATEPQSVQRWQTQGRLRDQLGLCAGSMSFWIPDRYAALTVGDVAADGDDVYTIDPDLLRHRPDDRFPDWTFWPGSLSDVDVTSRLAAVSADGGRVAVLDVGARKVIVLDDRGNVLATWRFDTDGIEALPSDIALSGDRVYLADPGAVAVHVRDVATGDPLGTWPVHDGPRTISATPDGGVFALGAGGWALQYDRDGRLAASWPMPDRSPEPVDIAAGADGRVYVGYVRWAPGPASFDSSSAEIVEAGVWVFEPAEEPAPPPDVPTDACLARPDKRAAPGLIPLGETVTVTLQVDGLCPGTSEPVQMIVLLDTSRSMNWDSALPRAKEMALWLIEGLDPRTSDVGLITFDDDAALVEPLTREHGRVAARVASLEAWGDSHLAAGITLAHNELTGPRGNPAARPVVVVISDGEFTDKAPEAAAPAREAGIEFFALALPHGGLSTYYTGLKAVTDSHDNVLVDPDQRAVRDVAHRSTRFVEQQGLFESITVEDEIPANMRYVTASARPPAQVAGRTLTWSLSAVTAAAGITLEYQLEPLEVGRWPTNVSATAEYRDALGHDGALVFPVPHVRVWDETSLTHRAYVPLGANRSCFRTKRDIDVVLVIDASQSMSEPAGDGRTKLEAARDAAGLFLQHMRLPDDRAAVVSFNDEASRAAGLTADRRALTAALAGLTSSPGTRIDRGLAEAADVLSEDRLPTAQPVVILLTDGLNGGPNASVLAEADRLRADGVLVFTIGLGAEIDAALLKQVATTPNDYHASVTAAELAAIYRRVLEELACRIP